MTLDELTTLVLDQKRDITDNFVDTDEIKRYFNQLGRRLNADHDFEFTQTSAGVSYTDGTTEYAVSAVGNGDFKIGIDLWGGKRYQFDFVSPENFNYLATRDNNVWATDNRTMFLRTSFGTASLSCEYYSNYMAQTSGGSWINELSTSSDTPLMPEMFQDVYVEYALSRVFKKKVQVKTLLNVNNV